MQQQTVLRGFGCEHDKGRTSGIALGSGERLSRVHILATVVDMLYHCVFCALAETKWGVRVGGCIAATDSDLRVSHFSHFFFLL